MDNENVAELRTMHTAECQPCPKFIETRGLARAYVPTQKMCEVYPPEKGLKCGTIFPELDLPYTQDWGNNHGSR